MEEGNLHTLRQCSFQCLFVDMMSFDQPFLPVFFGHSHGRDSGSSSSSSSGSSSGGGSGYKRRWIITKMFFRESDVGVGFVVC